MTIIRDAILQRMKELDLTTYRVSKLIEDKIPQRTVYAFLSGTNDASCQVASIIMERLGLTITSIKRGKRPRKEV